MTRPVPFECSYCGKPASERYYDPETGKYFASLCQNHLRHEDIITTLIDCSAPEVSKITAQYPTHSDSEATV